MRVLSERQLATALGSLGDTPRVVASALPPDIVLVQTSVPSNGIVSLGTEVNVLPAAIEAGRSLGLRL